VPKVEVDEVFCFMRNVAPKISTYNTVPGHPMTSIEFFLDVLSYVLLDVKLFHGRRGNFNGILLHAVTHISRLYHGLHLRGTTGSVFDHYERLQLRVPSVILKQGHQGCSLGARLVQRVAIVTKCKKKLYVDRWPPFFDITLGIISANHERMSFVKQKKHTHSIQLNYCY